MRRCAERVGRLRLDRVRVAVLESGCPRRGWAGRRTRSVLGISSRKTRPRPSTRARMCWGWRGDRESSLVPGKVRRNERVMGRALCPHCMTSCFGLVVFVLAVCQVAGVGYVGLGCRILLVACRTFPCSRWVVVLGTSARTSPCILSKMLCLAVYRLRRLCNHQFRSKSVTLPINVCKCCILVVLWVSNT